VEEKMTKSRLLTLTLALYVVVRYWTSSISVSADVLADAGLVEIV
jgi:hypothetical protein